MTININQNEEKITLALSGRLDAITTQKLQDALIPKIGITELVELDLAKLDYISSSGLRVLLLGEKTAKTQGCRLVLLNVTADVMEIFKMTGFSNVLHFE